VKASSSPFCKTLLNKSLYPNDIASDRHDGPSPLFNVAIVVALALVVGAWLRAQAKGFPTDWHFTLVGVVAVVLGWDLLVIYGLAVRLGIPMLTLPKKSAPVSYCIRE
jgi:uncharacterized membrane protein